MSTTSSRIERKYLIGAVDADALVQSLADRIAPHHHDAGHGCTRQVQHFATTVYFDTPHGCVRRAAERGGWHGKLRLREYYDVELPTGPRLSTAPVAQASDLLWLELKLRDGDRSCKHRLGVTRPALAELFDRGDPRLAEIARRPGSDWDSGEASRQALIEWSRSLHGRLRPSVVVSYRRRAWQSADALVRVTLDEELAMFRPHPELWSAPGPWLRDALGSAVDQEPRCVLEVKCVDGTPAWLERALRSSKLLPCRHSKFVRGARAISRAEVIATG